MRRQWWLPVAIALVAFIVLIAWFLRTDHKAWFGDALLPTLMGYLEEAERRGDFRLIREAPDA